MTTDDITLLTDEYAYYLDSHHDQIKEALCQIEGVPHSSYSWSPNTKRSNLKNRWPIWRVA